MTLKTAQYTTGPYKGQYCASYGDYLARGDTKAAALADLQKTLACKKTSYSRLKWLLGRRLA